jgi:DNA polymerase-3 subunit epsilon
MKLLFIDTETTDRNEDSRILQIAWLLTDGKGQIIEEKCFYTKPTDIFEIHPEAEKVHGISREKVESEGLSFPEVFPAIDKAIKEADYIVCHNINFDIPKFNFELLINQQFELSGILKNKKTICTMELSTNYCLLPGRRSGQFKWPKLKELHIKLFGKAFENAHDALADVKATYKCFFELLKLEVIKLEEKEETTGEIVLYTPQTELKIYTEILKLQEADPKITTEVIAYLLNQKGYRGPKGLPFRRQYVNPIIKNIEGPGVEEVKEPEKVTEATPETRPDLVPFSDKPNQEHPGYTSVTLIDAQNTLPVDRNHAYLLLQGMNRTWGYFKKDKEAVQQIYNKLEGFDKKLLIRDTAKHFTELNKSWIAKDLFGLTGPDEMTGIINEVEGAFR